HHEAVVADLAEALLQPRHGAVEPVGELEQVLLLALLAGHAVLAAVDLDMDLRPRAAPRSRFPWRRRAGATRRRPPRRGASPGPTPCRARSHSACARPRASACRLRCAHGCGCGR